MALVCERVRQQPSLSRQQFIHPRVRKSSAAQAQVRGRCARSSGAAQEGRLRPWTEYFISYPESVRRAVSYAPTWRSSTIILWHSAFT